MKFRSLRALAVIAIALCALASGEARANPVLTGTLTADNGFYAYIGTRPNTLGTLIASGYDWQAAFTLTPTTLTPGRTYYLNIEAINAGGPGGFSGVFALSNSGAEFANGSQMLTTGPSDLSYWSGSYNDSNSNAVPQPWVTATGAVLQDTSYNWGNVAGTADWIWPSDPSSATNGSSVCGSCTVDLTAEVSTTTPLPEPSTGAVMLTGFAGLILMRRRRRQSGTPDIAAAG